jgi:hypothetical protein
VRKTGERPEEKGDALNEDLSRILLGECLPLRIHPDAPPGGLGDLLRQARPLAEELARVARRLEGKADRAPKEVTADARRIREVAAALSDLLDLFVEGRAAA